MAERRMFSRKIVCSDAFTEMPFSAQALYFQLGVEADDDGFLNSPRKVMRNIEATEADLNLLLEKRFILRFPNGVIAIKHWRINNQIRKDRYAPTQYQDEFNSLEIKPDGAYTEKEKEVVDTLATTWQPSGNHLATQYRLGKDSLVEDSLVEGVEESSGAAPPSPQQKPSCQQIVDLYNTICTSFPSVRSLSESRKKAIKARMNTYSIDDFRTVFENAEASSFLKGANDRNWTATFDWLIKDQNMAKVLEGNYADKSGRGRKEIVPKWITNDSYKLGEEEIAAIKRNMANDGFTKPTLANDPELAERAEKLRQELNDGR